MAENRRRIVVLFSRLSGYMAACLKALKDDHQVALLVFRYAPAEEAPFESRHFDWIDSLHDRHDYTPSQMLEKIEAFQPDAAFMAGWVDRGYLKVARALRRRGVPVVAGCDSQWYGNLKQHVGCLIAPAYLHTAIDVLWTTGDRQRRFANRLGFAGSRCWSGYYACDWQRFADVYEPNKAQPRKFLFVGRYAQAKALDVLVDAYQQYREKTAAPWKLLCAGTGEQAGLLAGREGIEDVGFVQPDALPDLMKSVSAFVLPSRFEPWGVVIQEAATAGLPLICSDKCGATVHLLQDGYNGYLFETGNAEQLARRMTDLSAASDDAWREMGRRSHELSKQFTPRRWATTLMHGLASFDNFVAPSPQSPSSLAESGAK